MTTDIWQAWREKQVKEGNLQAPPYFQQFLQKYGIHKDPKETCQGCAALMVRTVYEKDEQQKKLVGHKVYRCHLDTALDEWRWKPSWPACARKR